MLKREPVLTAMVAALLVRLAATYGFELEPGTLTTLFDSGLAVAAAFFARSRVTPTN